MAFQLCNNVLDYALWGWTTYFYLHNHMSGSTNNVYVLSAQQITTWHLGAGYGLDANVTGSRS